MVISFEVKAHFKNTQDAIVALLFSICVVFPVAAQSQQRQCAAETPINSDQRFLDSNSNGTRDPGEVQRALPNNRIVGMRLLDGNRNLLFHWDTLPSNQDIMPANGIPDIGDQIIAQAQNYLRLIEAQGFKIPMGYEKCGFSNVITMFLYQTNANAGGVAGDASFDVYFLPSQTTAQQILSSVNPILMHELFHLAQQPYEFSKYSKRWIHEGQAALSEDIFDISLDDIGTAASASCFKQILASPATSMFGRQNPCQVRTFWRYFTEQLGSTRTEPSYGVDAMVGWFEYMETLGEAWRMHSSDEIDALGDFDGDGRDEFILRSDTHVGLIANDIENDRILDVVNFGNRLEGGWLLQESDRFLGAGDFNKNGRDEILVQSKTHFGFLASDRTGPLRSITSVANQSGTFGGGWRPSSRDEFLGIGDFDGDGADEAAIISSSHLGLVGLSRRNGTRTLHAQVRRDIQNQNRETFASTPMYVVGIGDLNGDGRDDIVGYNSTGLFVLSFRTEPNRFEIVATVDFGERVSRQWRLQSSDYIHAIGDLNHSLVSGASNRDEIVIRSDTHLGILGLNDAGQFVSHLIISDGYELSDELDFSNNSVVYAVGDMNDDRRSEIILRMDEGRGRSVSQKISILSASDDLTELTEISSSQIEGHALGLAQLQKPSHVWRARNNLLGGRIPIGRNSYSERQNRGLGVILNQGTRGAFLVIQGNLRRGYYRLNDRPEIDLVGRQIFGNYVQDMIDRTDRYIRSSTRNNRNLSSLWHDLSVMMYLKNFDATSLSDRQFLVDEHQFDKFKDWDDDAATPPVRVTSTLQSRGTLTESISSEPWSSHYFWVPESNSDRFILTTFLKRYLNRRDLRVFVVLHRDGELVELVDDPSLGMSNFTTGYSVPAGTELGVIVSVGDTVAKFDVAIVSSTR